MRVKFSAGMVAAVLLLAGCSISNQLTAGGQSVRFVEEQPGKECTRLGRQPVSKVTGLRARMAKQAVQCVVRQTPCVTRRQSWAAT